MRDVAYIALGSNLGDREQHLSLARKWIGRLPDTTVLAATVAEETEAFGPPGQGRYLNQMVSVETGLDPHELLAMLQRIETLAGRARGERWGPRTLDLDIVTFERQSISDKTLTIPHPGLRDRDFWKREIDELKGSTK